mgnify:CR=1 FL=1
MAQKKLDNFKHLKQRQSENVIDGDKYAAKIEKLLDAFEARFTDFTAEENNISLFTNPFAFSDEQLSLLDCQLQLELVDLKCNSALKGHFANLPAVPLADDLIKFWKMLPKAKFTCLRSFSQRFICRFASTYRCEQVFSAMQLIKNKNRSRLLDCNLNSLLILASTALKPDTEKLASSHQAHKLR